MKKSKTGLCILLVLSIIYGSLMFFSSAVMALALPAISGIYSAHPDLLPAEMLTAWERMAAIPRPFYAAMAFFGALSVTGCILMWNLRRSGYHCYAIAQLMMLVIPLLFLGKGYLGIGDIMFTALFLFIYYLQLKRLDVFTPKESITLEDGDNNN